MDLVLMEAASGKTRILQPGVKISIESGEHLPMMILSWSPIAMRLPGAGADAEGTPACDEALPPC
jgi:hypothetical protein